MLEVRLLGPPEATVSGRLLDVDTRKAIALLAYLAVEGTTTRDTLATLLWDDSPPERARATLRRTLSALRTAAAEDIIEADRNVVWLLSGYRSDLDTLAGELEATTEHGHDPLEVCPRCIPHLRAATDLYRGDFLEGFSVRASPEFDDWVRAHSESLRRRIGEAFNRLGTALAANGEYPAAIAAVSRWIGLDTLHEPAHRFLMLLHAWAGDRPAAIEAYRQWVAIVDLELGVPPLEETTELYEAILDEDLPPAPGTPKRIRATAQPRTAEPTDLIDRVDELRALRAGMEVARSRGHLASVTGPPWMGKTRLLEEMAREAREQGRLVLVGRAFPMEQPLPYGLVTQVLRGALPQVEEARGAIPDWALTEVGRLLPDLGGRPVEAAAADRFGELRLLEGIQTVIATLAEMRPAVVVLDDLHWSDAASAAVFSYFARRMSGAPVLVVASTRSGIGLPPSITEMLGGADQAIAIGPLTASQITPEVGDETLAREIAKRTGGVPLLVRELLDAPGDYREATPGILRYYESRLRELGELGRQILTAAAILDGTCDAGLLRETSGRSEEEVVEAVEELSAAGLLREIPETDALGFTLDALETMVYEGTSLVRRRLLHRRAARALAERAYSSSDPRLAAAIASHFHAAGDAEAADWYHLAGDLARAVYAHDSARDFYENSLALGNPRIAEIHLALGELAMTTGQYELARQELTTAASHAEPVLVSRVEHRLGEVERMLGRFKSAEEHFARALEGADEAVVLADWALLSHRTGDDEGAAGLAERARVAAERSDDARQLSRAHNILGIVTTPPEVALSHAEEALRLAGDDQVLRMAALNNRALLMAGQGDEEEAARLIEEAIAIAERTGHRHREAALWNHLADLHHRSGRVAEAQDALTRSVSLFAEIDAGVLEPELWLLTRW